MNARLPIGEIPALLARSGDQVPEKAYDATGSQEGRAWVAETVD